MPVTEASSPEPWNTRTVTVCVPSAFTTMFTSNVYQVLYVRLNVSVATTAAVYGLNCVALRICSEPFSNQAMTPAPVAEHATSRPAVVTTPP